MSPIVVEASSISSLFSLNLLSPLFMLNKKCPFQNKNVAALALTISTEYPLHFHNHYPFSPVSFPYFLWGVLLVNYNRSPLYLVPPSVPCSLGISLHTKCYTSHQLLHLTSAMQFVSTRRSIIFKEGGSIHHALTFASFCFSS